MKTHLKYVERIFDYTDKSKYDYVLNQSERSENIPDIFFNNFINSLTQKDFMYYPNTKKFKDSLCEFYSVDIDNLFLCDGSDVGIKAIFETFVGSGNVISSYPSFPMFKVYSELYNCKFIGVQYGMDNKSTSVDDLLKQINNQTQLIILANPNSPIGDYKLFEEIKPLLETEIPVLIDEAYIEFTDHESLVNRVNDYPNLLVSRTFSKAFGAAGARVGMVFSNKNYINLVSKFRQMYEISGVSMKYCQFLLDNYGLVEQYINDVKTEREKVLSLLSNFDTIGSQTNWIHFNTHDDNIRTQMLFDKHKVLTKYCSIHQDDLRKNWCRLTIQPNLSEQPFFKELLYDNMGNIGKQS